MKNILMVCLGNICRSPMAQGILREKIKNEDIRLNIDSAGTSDYHIDEAPDRRAIENMLHHGIDIRDLRGRQFTVADFDKFDMIFTMDENNYENVLALARNEEDRNKVDMMLNLIKPGENMSVPDPYFGGAAGFENVYNLLDQACDKIIEKAKNEA